MLSANYDLPRAARALRKLVSNPDDLPQVFTLIESLPGGAQERFYAGFQRTEEGRELLRDEPDIVKYLGDRAWLRTLPEGSLGRAYLDFVESENISAEGIIAASKQGMDGEKDDHLTFIRARMRDTHDLWHALTGYKGDVKGELALLGFILAQNFHPGIAAIISAAMVRGLAGDDLWLIADGFVRGKRAAWLPSVKWETLLDQPVAEVRKRLKVGEPRDYVPLRSSELRARGLVN